MSSVRPESQNVPPDRHPGAIIDDRRRELPVQTSAQALGTLFGTIKRECYQCKARIEPTNGEAVLFHNAAPPRLRYFRPERAVTGENGDQGALQTSTKPLIS